METIERFATEHSPLFEEAIFRHARLSLGKRWASLSQIEQFWATCHAVRDQLVEKMIETDERYEHAEAKRLYYLSMEFLIGRSLGNNLYNLGIFDDCKQLLSELGVDIEELREQEADAALGNGGLGRLAACFLDSLATLGLPGYGYGINYEYGLFKQQIEDGHQKEQPDSWRARGYPWLIERRNDTCLIPIYGRIEHAGDRNNSYNPMWLDWKVLIGIPNDLPIVGYGGRSVNYLRLYTAAASAEFDMQIFNQGDYLKAVEDKISTETVSKVLYPSDSFEAGRELRLIQEYFLVACTVRDIVRRYLKTNDTFDQFSDKVAIHLNDTHPALTVAELMRLLIDERDVPWEKAWDITVATLGYTNHTLLPEALEKWPVSLFERVLPRHLQIIYEINNRFLSQVESIWPGDRERARRMSIIEDGDQKQIRMGHLSIVGSHAVNGVASLHSELIKKQLVPDFYQMWPERFSNKTNGVTQRRWLLKANPELASLITKRIGNGWITHLEELRSLEEFADDHDFQRAFSLIKRTNKEQLARIIKETTGITVNTRTLFDVHIKRIHEYKRQLLNVLHIIHQYLRIIEDDQPPMTPRTFIFAGKAAPGYWAAKQIIKLINNVGRVINRNKNVSDMIKVVFVPDYKVSLAEKIIPAAELSEQISTAGREASGTGNMKLALNGALTIGTLDGANIEIREEVGPDNIFIFGLRAEEIEEMQRKGSYRPAAYCEQDADLRRVIEALRSNMFSRDERGLFDWICNSLLERDEYFLMADFRSYINEQANVSRQYRASARWTNKAILNLARIGKFSSDRTVAEYASEIWNIRSV